jgi:hypothetical protein
LSFEQWQTRWESYVPFSLQHCFSWELTLAGGSDRTPFGQYPHLGETARFPGTRSSRFTDRHLLGLWAQHRWRLAHPLSVFGLVMVGSVDSALSKLFERYRWGGGGGVEFHHGSKRSQFARLEIASFGGQLVFRATAGATL